MDQTCESHMVKDRGCTVGVQHTPTKLRKHALYARCHMWPSIVVEQNNSRRQHACPLGFDCCTQKSQCTYYANVPLHFNTFNFVFRFCIGFLRSITNWTSPYLLDFCYSHYYFNSRTLSLLEPVSKLKCVLGGVLGACNPWLLLIIFSNINFCHN